MHKKYLKRNIEYNVGMFIKLIEEIIIREVVEEFIFL